MTPENFSQKLQNFSGENFSKNFSKLQGHSKLQGQVFPNHIITSWKDLTRSIFSAIDCLDIQINVIDSQSFKQWEYAVRLAIEHRAA